MKKYLLLIIIFLMTSVNGFCVEKISPELQQSLKTTANEPSLLNIVFALGFVILLIYITGIIYSKLNIVGVATVKKQLKNADLNRAIILSTTQLGQNRNLHIIEVDDKRFLIGATPSSINLIKELSAISGEEKIVDENEIKSEKVDSIEVTETTEEFDLHKKYL